MSENLIERIFLLTTSKGDLVLDFFLGSGTTAAVAHKLGRRYIGIEQMDYIETMVIERLKEVISGEQGGISASINWKGGGSFVYSELMQWNERFVQKILSADNKGILQSLWEEIQIKGHLSYQINVKKDNNNQLFTNLSVEEQKQFLLSVLDKNQLYVNLSEMDDETYGVNDHDRQLNRLFYAI